MGEFARREGLREFLCLDSDVLIYENPVEIDSRVPVCRLAVGWIGDVGAGISPAVTYIRDPIVLQEIEASILKFYCNPTAIENMQAGSEDLVRKKLGGVSDMLLLACYAHQLEEGVFNLWEPEKDGVVDMYITQAAGFRRREGLKVIEFRDGKPYGFYEPTQRWVRFANLHFNGHSKKVVGGYLGRLHDFGLTAAGLTERPEKAWDGTSHRLFKLGRVQFDAIFCHLDP